MPDALTKAMYAAIDTMTPTGHEIEVLRMINGDLPMEHGAWVNACAEFLSEMGLVSRVGYGITPKGREFLKTLDKPKT